jgi:hypothetical protein
MRVPPKNRMADQPCPRASLKLWINCRLCGRLGFKVENWFEDLFARGKSPKFLFLKLNPFFDCIIAKFSLKKYLTLIDFAPINML